MIETLIDQSDQIFSKLTDQATTKIYTAIKQSGGLEVVKGLMSHRNLDVHLQALELIRQFFPSNDNEV